MPRRTCSLRSGPNQGSSPAPAIRSRKVRKLLKLEARAERLLARYERTLACAEPLLRRAEGLRREARVVELTLTGTEFGELRRARSGAAR